MTYYSHGNTLAILLENTPEIDLDNGYSPALIQAMIKATEDNVFAVYGKFKADEIWIGCRIVNIGGDIRLWPIRISNLKYMMTSNNIPNPKELTQVYPEILSIPYPCWYYEIKGSKELYNIHDNQVHYSNVVEFLRDLVNSI